MHGWMTVQVSHPSLPSLPSHKQNKHKKSKRQKSDKDIYTTKKFRVELKKAYKRRVYAKKDPSALKPLPLRVVIDRRRDRLRWGWRLVLPRWA